MGILTFAVEHQETEVHQQAIAKNPHATPEILEQIIRQGTVKTLVVVASNPNITDQMLEGLMATADRIHGSVAGKQMNLWSQKTGDDHRAEEAMNLRNAVLSALAADSAAGMLVRLAREYPGELRVVAIGPLTNIAQALTLDPSLPSLVQSATVMGGAALAPGNITPVAEANIWHDPEAAALVLAADWDVTLVPLDVTLVPLDVTMASVLEEPHRQALLASAGAVPRALGEMLGYYFRFYEGIYGRPCSAMHDPLAAALAVGAVRPALAPVVRAAVDTSDGPGRGQTLCDMRGLYAGYPEVKGARCRVVLALEEDFAPHLVETLLEYFEHAPLAAKWDAVTA